MVRATKSEDLSTLCLAKESAVDPRLNNHLKWAVFVERYLVILRTNTEIKGQHIILSKGYQISFIEFEYESDAMRKQRS